MKHRLACLGAVLAGACALSGVALAASSPSVTTGSSSKLTQTSAVLSAKINPNGSSTAYFFQWGLTKAYGLNSHPHSAGKGSTSSAIATTAGGLIPGTDYHYRVVAFNKFGTSYGADRTFKTKGFPPPAVATGPATQVGKSFATLTGVVNPNGTSTSFYFQYGITSAYGSQTFGGAVPAGHTAVSESVAVQGLAPGTIFHYRLVATHSGFAPSYGADQVFMTEPAKAPTPRMSARTAPHRARHRPFVFTTSGRLAGPSWIPAAFACTGEARMTFLHGRRAVAVTVAAVQSNCAFSAQTVLTRRPGRGSPHRRVPLRVLIQFVGNGYLARAHARPESVVVG